MWHFFKKQGETCRLTNPTAKQIWNFSASKFKVGYVYIFKKNWEECNSLLCVGSDSLLTHFILQTACKGWFSMFLA